MALDVYQMMVEHEGMMNESIIFPQVFKPRFRSTFQDVQSHLVQPVSLHVLVSMNQYVVKTSDYSLLGYNQGAKDSRYHGGAIINAATAGCQW